jgi:hypothetical protein
MTDVKFRTSTGRIRGVQAVSGERLVPTPTGEMGAIA